ncbi:MAG: ketol-acid reductoisomerase [Armatimonadota bacterium]|nr:ketol-acid reductoisomerase [Armatimonadota bacterium]
MATITEEQSIDPAPILSRKVGVIGFGSQGHAHAQNLRDSGVDVRVALREGSRSAELAQALGYKPESTESVSQWADVLVFAVADVSMTEAYAAASVREGQMLLFLHGFAIHYKTIVPPACVDVVLVSPAGPGPGLRALFLAGGGLASLCAVAQDFTGHAKQVALSYARAVGCAKAGVIDTTFQEETETDLFGEQAVLCGGLPELVKAGFQTLVDAGYQPEVAYFECLHQVKLITDLMYEGGLTFMRESISSTAEWGGYESGPRIVGEPSRAAMREVLEEIRSGTFAKKWMAEYDSGAHNLQARRENESGLTIERVGNELRKQAPAKK